MKNLLFRTVVIKSIFRQTVQSSCYLFGTIFKLSIEYRLKQMRFLNSQHLSNSKDDCEISSVAVIVVTGRDYSVQILFVAVVYVSDK